MNLNREQRRSLAKKLRKMKAEKAEIDKIISLYDEDSTSIPEGSKVKIDYEKIIDDPLYDRKLKKYKEAVEKLKDKICTVCYDGSFQVNPKIVCLEEDESEPKWLFFTGDLIRIEEEKTDKETAEKTEE